MKRKWLNPIWDFEASPFKKGQRPPKGWKVGRTTAAPCGCGHTMRIGGRFAFRNVKIVGFADKGYFDYAKTKA